MHDRAGVEVPGQGDRVALDQDVDVNPLTAKQQVAYDASDEVRGTACCGAQPLDAGQRFDARRQLLGLDFLCQRLIRPEWGLPYHDGPRGCLWTL